MASQLLCRPERSLPVAVLRVKGVLDPITADALRHAVTRSLSRHPEALLIDVGELRVGDPAGLVVLDELVGQASEWPGVPILFCGARAETARTLQRWSGRGGILGTVGDCERALHQYAEEPDPHRLRVRLRPVPDACRQVRQLVHQACAAWHSSAVAGTAALVATELVANVVRHAQTTMEFTVGLRDGRLCLAVRDGSRRLPRPADPGVDQAGGRGLRLVRDLTDAWGVLPTVDGKVVWTRLTATVTA